MKKDMCNKVIKRHLLLLSGKYMKCKTCLENKPISEYQKHKGFKSGVALHCKTCTHLKNKGRYKSYREMKKMEQQVKYIDWPASLGFEI